ncbi:Sialic acid TRAP transporter permease protein SiaT [Labrenzia sp. THAF191b]|uniref:TRAP transporter large permease n=2 Tax=Stappiaceae TaxID=2821832 RepID=UPI0012692FD2|nr:MULTISPECIES: TRAP transporter large permease subunit [Stappiaceae]QFS97228.1 Sialic acid TRAP transporter permease protein SiaT [Labrenzia sp. THAF191b]QFT03543.1 Sialic acid TRAP transporter permease protein SiaT [Labrenzia sp. THAF191a]QFT15085.1 Sialic acid TRAP transporter permease protein SiaT [Labrenzia sp. THAF187b]QFT66548.1 Sialic acid TRAP transporter permease protein SiaT [Labrenzia sp. THAF35]MBO9421608.1 TRAP transporter large permease subunit [Labrenzia sp. R4_2]
MTPLAIGFWGMGIALVLVALRVPIGLALGIVAFVGIAAVSSWSAAFSILSLIPYETAASWELSAIPMFLLMGALAFRSGLTSALFDAARLWLGWLPGGLAVATNFACAGFAAASGSSLATTLTMGRIALPEMKKAGYDMGLATGVVASAGTLGSLIPPSVMMILIGVFAQTSILKLFAAGIAPGLLSALAFALMVILRAKLQPDTAPRMVEKPTLREKLTVTAAIWPLPVLVLGVIGGIYSGVVTATEAGAFGAALTFVIALLNGALSWPVVKSSFWDALVGTATLFFIVLGAVLLTRFLAFSGLPMFLAQIMTDANVSPLGIILIAGACYLVLGMFLDPLGLLFLTLPIMLPMFKSVGLDMTLMGILIVKFVEIGLMSPPVGLNVFAVKSLVGPDVPLSMIYRGVLWFLVVDLLVIGLLIAFPDITLLLPRLMGL